MIQETDLYRTLGVQSSASADEIRRAYRILARRYHPDVNPGAQSTQRFAAISAAYDTLSDEERRRVYDAERHATSQFAKAAKRARAYAQNQTHTVSEQPRAQPQRAAQSAPGPRSAASAIPDTASIFGKLRALGSRLIRGADRSLSVVEVSLSLREAVLGGKKSVEVPDVNPNGKHRKISLTVPPASRNGTILQLRSKRQERDEILIIFRVASHPFIAIESRGIVVDLFLTLSEALQGATLVLPTFDEPVALTISAGTSSGQELRLKAKGVLRADSTRGDLLFRTLIRLPEQQEAREILARELELTAKESGVRAYLPKSLNEIR